MSHVLLNALRRTAGGLAILAAFTASPASSAQAGEVITTDCLHGSGNRYDSASRSEYGGAYSNDNGDQYGSRYSYTRPNGGGLRRGFGGRFHRNSSPERGTPTAAARSTGSMRARTTVTTMATPMNTAPDRGTTTAPPIASRSATSSSIRSSSTYRNPRRMPATSRRAIACGGRAAARPFARTPTACGAISTRQLAASTASTNKAAARRSIVRSPHERSDMRDLPSRMSALSRLIRATDRPSPRQLASTPAQIPDAPARR
jgi:hypothetical protein